MILFISLNILSSISGYPASKILIKLITGRRHQIRVHLSHIGHRIVGDYTYSNRHDSETHRMFLHSYYLEIPTKLETVLVQTEDPFHETDSINKWEPIEKLNELSSDTLSYLEKNGSTAFTIS